MRWEYLVHTVPADVISSKEKRPGELETILNRYGSEGWELINTFAISDDSDAIVLTFKRQAAESAPPRAR